MFVDTHTHLYAAQFDKDRTEVVNRAIGQGITKFYLPNIDSTSIEPMLELEKAFPEQCVAMMGLHPCSVKENYLEELKLVKEWLDKRPFVAVGEIGLDFYWDTTFKKQQIEAFEQQIDWAIELDIPIIIHSRNSTTEVLETLKKKEHPKLRGIFHCFGGSVEEAKEIIELGFLLGIGGVLTFKKSGLDKVMNEIELRNVVLETDAPYLAPTPHRGKRNESSYLLLVAKKLADIKGLSLDEVAEKTRSNSLDLFGDAL